MESSKFNVGSASNAASASASHRSGHSMRMCACREKRSQGFGRGSKLFFALGVPRGLVSSAALDVRNGRSGRKSRDTFHTARRDLRTVRFRSQNISCWPLLGRETKVHRLNSSFLRLRSGSDSASKYLWDGATPDSSAKNTEWLQLKPNVSPSKESSRAPC